MKIPDLFKEKQKLNEKEGLINIKLSKTRLTDLHINLKAIKNEKGLPNKFVTNCSKTEIEMKRKLLLAEANLEYLTQEFQMKFTFHANINSKIKFSTEITLPSNNCILNFIKGPETIRTEIREKEELNFITETIHAQDPLKEESTVNKHLDTLLPDKNLFIQSNDQNKTFVHKKPRRTQKQNGFIIPVTLV